MRGNEAMGAKEGCVEYSWSLYAPTIFKFPYLIMNDNSFVIPARKRRDVSLIPLTLPIKVRGEEFPVPVKYLEGATPHWTLTDTPRTTALTFLFNDPELVLSVMIERAINDILGSLHTTEPPALPRKEELGIKEPDINDRELYVEHPLMALPNRHLFKPGTTYTVPEAAPRIYRMTKRAATRPLSTLSVTSLSPRAALQACRLGIADAVYLMKGAYRHDYGEEYARTDHSLRIEIMRSGGLGGSGTAFIDLYPLKQCQALKSPISVPNQMNRALATLTDITDSVHEANLKVLPITSYDDLMTRRKTMQKEFSKYISRWKQAYTYDVYRTLHSTHDEATALGTPVSKERYDVEVGRTEQFLNDTMENSTPYCKALKIFITDRYSVDYADPSLSAVRHTLTPNRELLESTAITLWLYVLHKVVVHTARVRRLEAKELIVLSRMTGVPVQAFFNYYVDFEVRTGTWLPIPTALDDAIDLFEEWEQEALAQDIAGIDAIFYGQIRQELTDISEARELRKSTNMAISDRVYGATTAAKSNPLEWISYAI